MTSEDRTKKKKQAQIKPIMGQCPLSLEDRLNYVSYLYDFLKHGRENPSEWDGRRYGTLVTWAKLFADVHGWIPKTPINLTQVVSQQVTSPTREQYDHVVSEMPENEQLILARAIDRLTGSVKSP